MLFVTDFIHACRLIIMQWFCYPLSWAHQLNLGITMLYAQHGGVNKCIHAHKYKSPHGATMPQKDTAWWKWRVAVSWAWMLPLGWGELSHNPSSPCGHSGVPLMAVPCPIAGEQPRLRRALELDVAICPHRRHASPYHPCPHASPGFSPQGGFPPCLFVSLYHTSMGCAGLLPLKSERADDQLTFYRPIHSTRGEAAYPVSL